MTVLAAAEAYRLWAPCYSDETAISYLENQLVAAMTPPLGGLSLLDAGCGTGRRLQGCGADLAVGLEPNAAMRNARTNDSPSSNIEILAGDVRNMPFAASEFDVVWCRLVLGHLPQISEAYSELARVAGPGATVIVSDFHPAAADAGHRRSFRAGAQVIDVEHYVHRQQEHVAAASSAGLVLQDMREAVVGPDVRSFYERAGRLQSYAGHVGLPIVLALSFRKAR